MYKIESILNFIPLTDKRLFRISILRIGHWQKYSDRLETELNDKILGEMLIALGKAIVDDAK